MIYADVPNEKLVRHIAEHEDDFFLRILVDRIYNDTDAWEDRFREPEDEWDWEHVNSEGKLWDCFAGSEKSKI